MAPASPRSVEPANPEIAAALERIAELLEVQGAGLHRVRAYRRAAEVLRTLERPVAKLDAEGGPRALEELPAVGRSIAALIDELLHTGRIGLLDRLEGEVSPVDLFRSLPGLGDRLAHRLHDELGLDTLEELEQAAHDGRLERLPGFGPGRASLLRDALAARLGHSARRRSLQLARARPADGSAPPRPGVELLLELDAAYRRGAAEGSLPRIAPRRFNPARRAWLPVLHAERGGWSFHALFSNTARAHRLGATDDWVVIYWERDGEEGQCTVVTERRGTPRARRVVRGREAECAASRSAGKSHEAKETEAWSPSDEIV